MEIESMGSSNNELFTYGQFLHKIFGMWPTSDPSTDKYYRIRSYVACIMTVAVGAFQMPLITELTDIESKLEFAVELIISMIAIVKVLSFVAKRSDIMKLIEISNKLAILPSGTFPEDAITEFWKKLQNKIIMFLIMSYSTLEIMYSCFPIFTKNLPMKTVLPTIAYVTPWFQITYLIEIIILSFRYFACLSGDIIICTFVCQLLKELEFVQCSMLALKGSNEQTITTMKRHIAVMEYGSIICQSLSSNFMIQHIINSGFLCLVGITIKQIQDILLLARILSIGMVAIGVSFAICMVGEYVMTYSLRVAAAIEENPYENCLYDVAFLKNLNFALMRAQKPFRIRVSTNGCMNLRFFSESMNKDMKIDSVGSSNNEPFTHGQFLHKIFGIWPTNEPSLDKFYRIRSHVASIMTLAIGAFQTSLIMELTDVKSKLEFAIELMICLIASIKVVSFAAKRKDIMRLIEITKRLATLPSGALLEDAITEYWKKFRNKIVIFLIISYSAVQIMYISFPIFTKKLPMNAAVPTILYATPWFQITYLIEVLILSLRYFACLSGDIYICTFICQLLKELELLQYSMLALKASNKQTRMTIKRHIKVTEYGSIICKLLSPSFMAQHIITSGFLCLVAITIKEIQDILLLTRILSLGMIALVMLLIFCVIGEAVINFSLGVAAAIEENPYENCLNDVAFLKYLNFALLRAQRPFRIRVSTKSCLNLSFFSETMNKVLSFFLFLKTMVE